MRSEKREDAESSESGERAHEAGDQQPDAGAPADIEATGDAILISEAIHTLAGSFRELAAAIRQVTAQPDERDEVDEDKQERYLDGTPIKK